jgi:hypothetical protein
MEYSGHLQTGSELWNPLLYFSRCVWSIWSVCFGMRECGRDGMWDSTLLLQTRDARGGTCRGGYDVCGSGGTRTLMRNRR